MIKMVKRTKKEFEDYNAYKDRPFGLKWGTAYAMDDLMKGVRANEEYALKNNAAKKQMTRNEIDNILSEAFLKHKEVNVQLNLRDEFGRLLDSFSGYFQGESYQDYFILGERRVSWDDVRNIEINQNIKWYEVDMFEEKRKAVMKDQTTTSHEVMLEKNEFYQPFYEEGDPNELE